MFTGIIEEVGRVNATPVGSLVIASQEVIKELKPGESVAVNGVCLTATHFGDGSFTVDLMPETVRRSNLGRLRPGDRVNLESPLKMGGHLGGHLVQGHIDAMARIVASRREDGAMIVKFQATPEIMHYVVEKGFVAVDGVSLTVTAREATSFEVSLVDYTRGHSILGGWQSGDLVNLEVDIIAKYVEQLCQSHHNGITADFLQEHGFLVS